MEKVKMRNLQNECKFVCLLDCTVIFIVLAAAELILPTVGPIGARVMPFLYALDGVISVTFMYWLEKYTLSVCNMSEKIVITVLSSLYSFIIMSIVNLCLYAEPAKLVTDAGVMLAQILFITAADSIMYNIFSDVRKYRKPRLLIIDSNERNCKRMKKVKYGVLQNFDSWYENMDGLTEDEMKRFIEANFPLYDAVCVFDALPRAAHELAVGLASELNMDLFIVPKMIDAGVTNSKITIFDDVLTMYMPKTFLSNADMFFKRAADIVVASVGLIAAAVPMAIIAAVIKLTSPGPVIYKQTRLTKDKREFEIYKFRTMIPDAEKISGPKFAEKDDPRITPIGKLLRACRLDELPQIINVLKNDMSIVGPRPERPVFVKQFESEIPYYNNRFRVKAGLTSLSHVYGRYSTYIYDRTYYDLFYVTHYSLLLDFKIILLTSKTMFLKASAEGVNEGVKKESQESNGRETEAWSEVEFH